MLTPTAKLYKPKFQTAAANRLATHIGHFLREKDFGGHRRPQVFSQLLLAYLAKRGTEIETIMGALEGKKESQDTAQQQPEQLDMPIMYRSFSLPR